ncbi:MAG TPA: SOS response-associated peptidase [Mycobacteriales bacterium]|jgi:putative SOS response-associated peptidase YedK|nr:SOS response-associated peptidase [Mycobacteriales bacterium]
MCGRYASTRGPDELTLVFDAEDGTGDAAPEADYNVAPTKPVYAVRSAPDGARRLDVVSWGLVPSWARDRRIASKLLNARAETLATTPAFRSAFARRRCLVPADGWYEWTPRPDGPGKQPYFLTPVDGSVLAFAGLWETWGAGPDRLVTCTVVTTASHGALADVHDRMPLVLRPERWAAWLGEAGSSGDLLAPPESDVVDALEIRPVGPHVGNVTNNGPDLVTPRYGLGDAAPIPTLF